MIDRYDAYGRRMEDTEPDTAAWFVRFDQHNDRIREVEAALRELYAQLAQGYEAYDAKMSPSTQAATIKAEQVLGSTPSDKEDV